MPPVEIKGLIKVSDFVGLKDSRPKFKIGCGPQILQIAITLLRKQERYTTIIFTISFLMMGIFKISTWLIKKMSHEIKYR